MVNIFSEELAVNRLNLIMSILISNYSVVMFFSARNC